MPKFVYRGDVEVYVPDLARFVKPGDVVELPADPNHGLFEPVKSKPEKKD